MTMTLTRPAHQFSHAKTGTPTTTPDRPGPQETTAETRRTENTAEEYKQDDVSV